MCVQNSRPWQDLLYTLKKRERLLHAVHPFADVLRATKQRLLRAPTATAQVAFASASHKNTVCIQVVCVQAVMLLQVEMIHQATVFFSHDPCCRRMQRATS